MPTILDQGESPMDHNRPFRHKRGGYRRKKGLFSALARAGGKEQLNIGCSFIGLLAAVGYLLWRFVIGPMMAANAAPPPTPLPPTPAPIAMTATPAEVPVVQTRVISPVAYATPLPTVTPNGTATQTPIPSVPEVAPMGAGSVTVFGTVDFAGGCPIKSGVCCQWQSVLSIGQW